MPVSRSERIVFAVGLGLIALLAVLLLPAWKSYHDAEKSITVEPRAVVPAVAPADASELATSRERVSAKAVQLRTPLVAGQATVAPSRPEKPAVAASPALRVSAARGDCWIEVHRDSKDGRILYVGTLARGKALSFPLGKLWIRFGAPQNVDAFIGTRKTTLPTASFNVTVTRAGVETAA